MSCSEQMHKARRACRPGDDFETVAQRFGLTATSGGDPQNEVVCRISGHTRPIFHLQQQNGGGAEQIVQGWPRSGGSLRQSASK